MQYVAAQRSGGHQAFWNWRSAAEGPQGVAPAIDGPSHPQASGLCTGALRGKSPTGRGRLQLLHQDEGPQSGECDHNALPHHACGSVSQSAGENG